MTLHLNLQWLYRIRYPVFLVLSSVVAFAIAISFFSPRFVVWKAWGVWRSGTEILYYPPEIHRAPATFKKVQEPFKFVEYPRGQNADINWRLLFPLVGHYLRMPITIFFALPYLGCLLVLALITHIVCRATANRLLAFATAVLAATTSWFFVSTGWLGYFDSWYLLGLLAVAFVPNPWALGVACALAPWVDERFVLTAPLCLIARAIYFKWFDASAWNTYRRDVVVFLVTIGLYVLPRLFMTVTGTEIYPVTHHLRTHNFLLDFDTTQMLESVWTGLRAAWVFVIVFLWFSFPPEKRWWSAGLLGAVLITEITLMALAGDFSRNMSTLLPTVVLGVLLLARVRERWLGWVVAAALVFNLLAPAVHGFNTWRVPINNLYKEIQFYKDSPEAVAHNSLAVKLAVSGDLSNALAYLNYALALKPRFQDALFNRAVVRHQLGDTAGAAQDLSDALRFSPADWDARAQAERMLAEIRQRR